MKRRKFTEVSPPDVIDGVVARAPYVVDLPHGLGPVTIYQADMSNVGRSGEGISIIIGRRRCGCGCDRPALAFELMPGVEEARKMAARLMTLVDAMEVAANAAAAEALARAGKPRP